VKAQAHREAPADQNAQTYGPQPFVPMLDWFARTCVAAEGPLSALGEEVAALRLGPAQLMDRLLWCEAVGVRFFSGLTAESGPSREASSG
jgi:hypothetical protein